MNDFRPWYDALSKPSWTPPPETIGLIWTIVYPLIAIAVFGTVARVLRGELPRTVLIPLAINLAANVAFTPIQFGLRNLGLATADIVVVALSIVWWMWAVWKPGSGWIVAPLAPYLAWVWTATVLQVSITLANR